jgi:hypothetical protein
VHIGLVLRSHCWRPWNLEVTEFQVRPGHFDCEDCSLDIGLMNDSSDTLKTRII